MITQRSDVLSLWADVQIHALNPDTTRQILLRGEDAQLPALEAVANAARKLGAEKIKIITINNDEMSDLIKSGDRSKIASYLKHSTDAINKTGADNGAVTRFAGSADLNLKSRLQAEYPENFKIWMQEEAFVGAALRSNFTGTNAHPWLVGYAPAEGDAALIFPHLPLAQAIESAWDIAFKVNMCDKDDPIAAWEELDRKLHERCNKLNSLGIDYVEISGSGTKATVGFSELSKYLGGSEMTLDGRRVSANRPSFEVWTAPHRDRIEGVIRATVPFLCEGVKVEGLEVRIVDGKITQFTTTKGNDHFKNHISALNASMFGEFAIVDGDSPIADVPFTNQTIIEENRRNHVAVGNAYKTNIIAGETMSEEDLAKHGVNTSAKHTDFMWGSPESNIIGYRRDGGSPVEIMLQGKIVL